ncbi:MAG TPA: sigma-70 family RNA polymerase sigma factor [Solirubrobacteraceae bacterium]|jgi:RNA polymerase sigma factor (sigma-70 family)|nr:sigma-70 family RNA polymerase sigma factor [Solirubrobacteraceae bacterium]
MGPSGLSRYRAERLLRKDFAALRSRVLAVVRARLSATGVTLDAADLEASYSQAWHGLYAKVLAGETVDSPAAWLVLVTFRRAIDEARSRAHVEVGLREHAGAGADPAAVSHPDIADELDDRDRLRQLFEGLRTSLSPREREAASLCYLHGLSRAQAADRMQISEARMRKLMEGAGRGRPGVAGKMTQLLDTIGSGGWCEQQASLMRALAFGVLDPDGERHELALAHCRQCPACRAYVLALRGLASVLPLPLLSPLGLAGSAGTTQRVGTGSSAAGRPTGAWSGLSGSLTAKLAVTALVLLGAGYAATGGHARSHGSPPGGPPAARSIVAAPTSAGQAPGQALHPPIRAGASHPGRRSAGIRRRPTSARRRPSHPRAAPSAGSTAGRDFLPESPASRASSASPPAGSGSSQAAREFGLG